MGNRTTVHVSSQIVVACLSPGARGGQAGWPLATITKGLPSGAVLLDASVNIADGDLRMVFEVPGAEDVDPNLPRIAWAGAATVTTRAPKRELARLLALYAPTVKDSLSVTPDHTEESLAMVEPSCIDFAADSPLHRWEYKTLKRGRQARRCSVCWRLDTWSPPRGYQGQAVVEPAPAPAQREPGWWCCGADYDEHEPTCRNYKPEPAPAPADTGVTGYDRELAAQMHPTPAQRWRCEGCGAIIHDSDPWREVNTGGRVHYPDPSTFPLGKCGPVVPVGEAGS